METTTYKAALEAEKKSLEVELSTVARRSSATPEDWEPVAVTDERPAERDEVADKIESFEENVALTRQLEARLAEVTSALARIAVNAYGLCAVCKKAIEPKRLDANPAATTCKAHLK
jgi:RNA polymerase-binding transcription factor DksA